ncbi:DUF5695 domain-containing protein [Fimbriimonas ginsengisoli]|uniref:Uncharacterized protein n=1 Tax=Fimbriimonas ginsengisoli Gsoil 348 TaxID=661478 RepID=A0A068NVU9_FIMGI|nr:DUF5695 domain-containing protein [Fimbriimonas ginsengisoli]AIE86915.1 hypothetical protein OP10G_3547 [Fimbriimonas ginsengisoli Gsoil 348]
MDDFSLDRQELTGSLISMEFGPGGRIQQLWASDPNAPDESEEFQFVAPPMNMGEELTDDYFPGTILLGARTHPEDPWIVSRNTRAEPLEDDEDGRIVAFSYEFAFLEELSATGRFYEIPGAIPQIAWDVRILNRSRRSVEIGELGFPLALNNVLEGFARTDKGTRDMFSDRLHVHKFIGGAASYVFAQRLNARPPGLLIFPGGDTTWEFFNHVPGSLHTPFRWEGIPVVYAHSRAAIEREGWGEWFGGHTSVVLEPGEERIFQMRFVPVDRDRTDNLSATLAACGRPAMRLFPSAVAPFEVGIAVEVAGATPTRFLSSTEMELETDSDDEGGFCFVKPAEPGPITVAFEDTLGRVSECQLLFTPAIVDLIHARADWIVKHQVFKETGALENAILPADNVSTLPINEPDAYVSPFGIESSLADALFLAEKNTIYPAEEQIAVLDRYLTDFVEDDLQNPGDGSVGSSFPDPRSVATNFGRPQVYPLVFCLYQSMARIATGHGGAERDAKHYLERAAKCAIAMFRHVEPTVLSSSAVPLMAYLPSLVDDLHAVGLEDEAHVVAALARRREMDLQRRRYPYGAEVAWTAAGFEEAYSAARHRGNEELQERTLRCAYAARSLAPSWWWYGSDKRWLDDGDGNPAGTDRGELCLGPTTTANSMMFLRTLDRDYTNLPEATLRLAFGGMLGVWALVRPDGAAGMAFCPDAASKHFGMSAVTGDVGIGLFHYLRGVASFVLPTRYAGVTTFGCHFEVESEDEREIFVVRPWDGVGRRIVVRQVGLEVEASLGFLRELRFDARKRNARLKVEHFGNTERPSQVRVKGLWGSRFTVDGKELQGIEGELVLDLILPPHGTVTTMISVIG